MRCRLLVLEAPWAATANVGARRAARPLAAGLPATDARGRAAGKLARSRLRRLRAQTVPADCPRPPTPSTALAECPHVCRCRPGLALSDRGDVSHETRGASFPFLPGFALSKALTLSCLPGGSTASQALALSLLGDRSRVGQAELPEPRGGGVGCPPPVERLVGCCEGGGVGGCCLSSGPQGRASSPAAALAVPGEGSPAAAGPLHRGGRPTPPPRGV